MSKLVVTTFVTLDGVMQAPGGPEEDRDAGFEHGGWLVPYFDEEVGAFMNEVFQHPDAFLLGRRTYEIFTGHWPHVTDEDDPVATKLNTLPKYVASRTLERADWQNSTIIRDVPADVAALKDQPGDELQVHGSATLIQTLIAQDLVDAFNVLTFPVVVGTGKRLFEEGAMPTAFRLVECRTSGTGVVTSRYERLGRPTYGAFGLDT